ncbi:hypothetical protein [Albirhodobacter sp. R86504]|uniref:hypothetical protein n=1 Tax=Albirhodobacter sp. R86504 TaxID=3093848 RepID=UPI00366E232E
MEIILHTGAHRTGTTSFQYWLRMNMDTLADHGTAIWDPVITRREPFMLFNVPLDDATDTPRMRQTTAKRLRTEFARLEARGIKRLLISEENILGGLHPCFGRNALYPEAHDRLTRLRRLFGDRISRFAFTIRDYRPFWGSAVGLMVARKNALPTGTDFRKIAANPRGWRDLSEDFAAQFPEVPQIIAPFERFLDDPFGQLTALIGAPPVPAGVRLTKPVQRNASPSPEQLRAALGAETLLTPAGKVALFFPEEIAAMEARYTDDQAWFVAQTGPVTYLAR